MSNGNTPAMILWDGNLKVTIWRNEKADGDGFWFEHVPGRVYTDKASNQAKTSGSFSGSEPLRIGHLMQRAYEWERQARLRDKQDRKAAA